MVNFLFFFSFLGQVHASCEVGFQYFKTEFHPALMKNCAECHGGGGIAPPHSQIDSKEAYLIAKNYLDLQNPRNSLFIEKVEEEHWTFYDPNSKGMTVDQIQPFIESWSKFESECEQNPDYQSKSVFILKEVPGRESGKSLRFQTELKAEVGDLKVQLEFEIQKFGEVEQGMTYHIQNLRISSNESVEVDKVELFFNTQKHTFSFDIPHSFYREDLKKKNSSMLGAPILSRAPVFFVGDRNSNKNEIKVSFYGMKKKVTEECFQKERFSQTLNKRMNQFKCKECHHNRFSIESTEAACFYFSEMIDHRFPRNSVLMDYPIGGREGHPVLDFFGKKNFISSFMDWVKK